MFTNEFDERRYIGFPVLWKALQVLECGGNAAFGEERYGVVRVFVEIRVEDSLVHEVRIFSDIEEHPPQVVQFQWRQYVGIRFQSLLQRLSIFANGLPSARLDFGNDRKAITSRGFRKHRPVLA